MKGISVTSQVSLEDLLRSIEQMDGTALEQMLQKLLNIQAERRQAALPAQEAALLKAINTSLPAELLTRYQHLLTRRRDELLTAAEHQELIGLTDQWETLAAVRLQHLIHLAAMRNIPLDQLQQEMGIRPTYE